MADTALGNITSANASLVLTVNTVIPAGAVLTQFSTDQSFAQNELTIAEDRMGVDGHLAAGWVPSIKTVTINLEASSPSYEVLAMLLRAMEANRTVYECTLVATVPSIRKIYTWSRGVLKNSTAVASAKKVLEPTGWTFDFARLDIASY